MYTLRHYDDNGLQFDDINLFCDRIASVVRLTIDGREILISELSDEAMEVLAEFRDSLDSVH